MSELQVIDGRAGTIRASTIAGIPVVVVWQASVDGRCYVQLVSVDVWRKLRGHIPEHVTRDFWVSVPSPKRAAE